MNRQTPTKRIRQIVAAPLAMTLMMIVGVHNAQGAIYQVFADDYDAKTVGAFPTPYTLSGSNSEKYVTNNISVSPPNSFQVGNPNNAGFEISRPFSNLNLGDVAEVRFSYDLAVTQIPDGSGNGNVGFNIGLGNEISPGGGFLANLNYSTLRVFSDAGSSTSWRLYEPVLGNILTNNLALNTFYNIEIEFKPNDATPSTGTVEYLLDGNSLGIFNYSSANIDIDAIRISANTGTGAIVPYSFKLDNAQLEFMVPEPSTVMLFGIGGVLLWRKRRWR